MAFQFWFDFASTYSYPAAMRIESVALSHRVDVEWNAFLLGPVFKAQGWNDSPFNIYPTKGKYMWRDLQRICDSLSIPFRRPSMFPRNGLLAARIATRFKSSSWIPDFVRAVYRANFADDLEIGDSAVIADCLAQIGLDANEILGSAASVESKSLLRSQNDAATQLNIFGAPSVVANGELFWGNDRLEQAFQWLAEPQKVD
jgi:2-hydroxychromene-2-carboxylate isomerase